MRNDLDERIIVEARIELVKDSKFPGGGQMTGNITLLLKSASRITSCLPTNRELRDSRAMPL